jgi:hypothetical protein
VLNGSVLPNRRFVEAGSGVLELAASELFTHEALESLHQKDSHRLHSDGPNVPRNNLLSTRNITEA